MAPIYGVVAEQPAQVFNHLDQVEHFIDTDIFPAPTVVPGEVTILPGLVTSADSFYAPFVQGPVQFDTASNVTLSNFNLTADHTNTSQGGARSASQQNGLKRYFEITVTVVTGVSLGIGVLTAAGTFNDLATGNNCGAVYAGFGGPIFGDNAFSSKSIGNINNGDIVSVAVDLVNEMIWFSLNGGFWNGDSGADPATNTGGVSIASFSGTTVAPAICYDGAGTGATESVTANFGSSAFTYTVPSGFLAGWV